MTAAVEAVPWICNLMNCGMYYSPSLLRLGVLWECIDAKGLSDGYLKRMILSWNSSQRLTIPTDFSDNHSCFVSLLPEPEVDNPKSYPSCLTTDHQACEVVCLLFACVTPSLSVTLSLLVIMVWAHSRDSGHVFPSCLTGISLG